MDAPRFDHLTRSLSSRRTAVSGLLGGALATLLGEAASAHNPVPACRRIKDTRKRAACRRKAKRHNAQHCSGEGTPCADCRTCQGGMCAADASLNNVACGSDGTGRCLNGRCNPVPTCSPRYGSCATVADCCSAGSTMATTTCPTEGPEAHTCRGRSDPGQPCHDSMHCVGSSGGCIGYICQ